jgi:hypothetical protein
LVYVRVYVGVDVTVAYDALHSVVVAGVGVFVMVVEATAVLVTVFVTVTTVVPSSSTVRSKTVVVGV